MTLQPPLTGRADLHMHTDASDGIPSVRQLLDHVAKTRRLDVIAITDHDTLDSSLWAYGQRHLYPFDVIPGVEVTARAAHVLGLWVMQPIPMYLSIAETVTAIHEQGGVAILAHPGEFTIGGREVLRYLRNPTVLLQWGLDGVEVFNAGTVTPGNNVIARRIVRGLNLPLTGSSDAHTLGAIGRAYTRFAGSSASDFRSALAAGATTAEGMRWAITDYLKLSMSLIPIRRNKSMQPNSLSTYPTA